MSKRVSVSLPTELVEAIEHHPDYSPSGGTRSGLGGWLYKAALEKLGQEAGEDYHQTRSRYWAEKRDEK